MRVEQARSQTRRQRILEAAALTFSRRGYRATSVDDIAEASATSKGGIYFHFPNKEAIFLALLEGMAALLHDRMERAMAEAAGPEAKLDAALLTMLHTFGAHRTLARLFLVDAMGANREFSARIMEIQEGFVALIERQLQEAIAEGALPAVDTEITSVAWFGALLQVVTHWLLLGKPADLNAAYPALRALLLRSVALPAADRLQARTA
jgi:TetR/AcrR family transcriptional regulator, fatty acid metabolism regulator protein